MESFKLTLEHLDHVAIRIKDMNESVDWYQKVLGLKKYQLEKWGEFPIFMLAGKTGITLFPADLSDTKLELNSKNIKIDHFAFKVSKDNFERAKKRYMDLNLEFTVKDHHYFHSIYTKDPDDHTVELTTLVVNEKDFYKEI